MPGRSKRSEALPSRRPHRRLENAFRAGGHTHVAGVDEVGRGCLFGPVVAAAVILDAGHPIRGLNDSKQIDPAKREEAREMAESWDIVGWNVAGLAPGGTSVSTTTRSPARRSTK